ncbi:MAG: radical SAM protein [Candidatus Omnitrophota bacterium]|nr:radical SAM protein [Candidatus Omnitrophota bacterium]
MIDILLVNPFSWTIEKRPCYLPYGVLYLAGFLRQKGLKVDIYDRNTDYSLDIQKCMDYFKEKKPAIVGLSVLTGPVISDAIKISRAIKSMSPGTRIVWGGLHPTIFSQCVLKEDNVDFIIQGEGELPMLELCRALLDNNPYSGIRNLGFKDNGRIVLNPIREELLDLDANDMPAWDLLDIRHYVANRFFASRVLTMNTSRGCPFKCTFCFNQGLPYQRWRGLSAAKIKKQIDYLYKSYGINGIQFYEDSFDTDKKRVREFCGLMLGSGMNQRIKWSHFSNIPYFDREVVSYEKEAGLRYIEYGVESGSQRILDWVNKRQTVVQIKEVFEECRKIGIKTAALFMIGFPDESYEELMMTVDLVEGVPAHILICTIYRPYPGTPLFEYCVKNKKFSPPQELEEQAEFYRFSHMHEEELNMSNVPTRVLLGLQKRFYAKFVISEALLCIKELNFGLLIYYFKQQVHPGAILYTLKSLLTRIRLISKERAAR